jgi:hypothetical protein
LDGTIPEEKWTGKKVNYSFLKFFGCEAFVHIDKENRTKLEEKSKKCTFIGYSVNDFGYLLWDYENKKIIRSKYVIFNCCGGKSPYGLANRVILCMQI